MTLDLASNSRNGLELGSLELSYLNVRVEHSLDESSVFVNLVRLSNQLKLLHYLELSV